MKTFNGGRAFDGADTGYRLSTKGLYTGSADSLAQREKEFLLRRSRHLCRNNPLAVAARSKLISRWIGTGIYVKWNNKKVQAEWDLFADSPCLDGAGDLNSLQTLWASGYFEAGEIFTRMLVKEVKGRKVPLLLQVLESEQLDMNWFQGMLTKYGITFSPDGKPETYHFWNRFPNEWLNPEQLLRVEVDARDVIHIMQKDRAAQWRGIPKLAPTILALYETDELLDATLVRQKGAMAVGWIITKKGIGAAPLVGALEEYNENLPLSQSDAWEEKKLQKVKPGGIHYLEEDEEFQFASIDDIGTNLTTLLEYQTRLISAALDLTYEQISGDLSKVNYSSIRAGLMEVNRKAATIQQLIFITQGLKPLTERFKELGGIFVSPGFASATCKFILPKVEWVDPLKDAQADLLECRAGFSTLTDKLGERGIQDIEEHIAQLTKEQGLDIVLESNPSKNLRQEVTDSNSSETGKPKRKPSQNPPVKKGNS